MTEKGKCAYNRNMNKQVIAIIIQEGGKFVSELIKNRSPGRTSIVAAVIEEPPTPIAKKPPEGQDKASGIEAGCVACATGHLGTCSGVLNEAMRFARKDGIKSVEVIDRVNICMDELNALERIDLRPELTLNLPPWEKELADKALAASRTIRHNLEGMSNIDDLELAAATTQATRQKVGREWFRQRLANLSPEEKKKVAEKAIEKVEEALQ